MPRLIYLEIKTVICIDCDYKKDCQLYGDRTYSNKETCIYKSSKTIEQSAEKISEIISDARDNDPEFYKELQVIFNT